MAFALFAADPETSSWAASILVQFPIVGLVFLAVRWASRNSDRRYAEFLDRLQRLYDQSREAESRNAERVAELGRQLGEDFDRAVNEVKAAHEASRDQMQARHQAELDRLERAHAAHVQSLNAEIRRLAAMNRNRPNTGGGAP